MKEKLIIKTDWKEVLKGELLNSKGYLILDCDEERLDYILDNFAKYYITKENICK